MCWTSLDKMEFDPYGLERFTTHIYWHRFVKCRQWKIRRSIMCFRLNFFTPSHVPIPCGLGQIEHVPFHSVWFTSRLEQFSHGIKLCLESNLKKFNFLNVFWVNGWTFVINTEFYHTNVGIILCWRQNLCVDDIFEMLVADQHNEKCRMLVTKMITSVPNILQIVTNIDVLPTSTSWVPVVVYQSVYFQFLFRLWQHFHPWLCNRAWQHDTRPKLIFNCFSKLFTFNWH